MNNIYIIGAGGHSKVIIALLESLSISVTGIVDDDCNKLHQEILGIPIIGNIDSLKQLANSHANIKAIIGIGNNAIRKKIAEKFRYTAIEWLVAIHENAYVHHSVYLGEGSVIFAGAIIQPDVTIGQHCIINTSAHIDHDCMIADYVHVAPGVGLAGNVHVEEGAFMGIGSKAIPNAQVGAWSTVGAGATVIKDIPNSVIAVGTPATILNTKS